ncbi:MAG: hypothetical protein ACRDNF_19140, partial [Streptosporangiaceae bacterium]
MDFVRPAGWLWMDRLGAWWSSPVRDALYALGMAALLLYGAYGEAHPTKPYISAGQHVPHTPAGAYLLVLVACLG